MLWMAVLSVVMRSVHILSVVTLLGGVLFAVTTAAPMQRFAPWLRWSSVLLVLSGVFNLVTKQNIPPRYHLWFGIKMLLALHILAVSILLSRSSIGEERKTRLAKGVLATGVVVVVLSAYLRFLANWMLI